MEAAISPTVVAVHAQRGRSGSRPAWAHRACIFSGSTEPTSNSILNGRMRDERAAALFAVDETLIDQHIEHLAHREFAEPDTAQQIIGVADTVC